jgi:hypothetical protein
MFIVRIKIDCCEGGSIEKSSRGTVWMTEVAEGIAASGREMKVR